MYEISLVKTETTECVCAMNTLYLYYTTQSAITNRIEIFISMECIYDLYVINCVFLAHFHNMVH